MNIMIIDDEPLARQRLQRLLSTMALVRSVIEAANGIEARALLKRNIVDVILLDIQMPGESGLEFGAYLLKLNPRPAVVLVTAHPEHALNAYAILPVGYLVKPVSAAQLEQVLNRLNISQQTQPSPPAAVKISYQLAGVTRQVDLDDVLYFAADDKYVRMVFHGGQALLEKSLAQLEQQFPHFLQRIHRHTLVNWQHFDSFSMQLDGKAKMTLKGCAEILDVSRREASRIKQLIGT